MKKLFIGIVLPRAHTILLYAALFGIISSCSAKELVGPGLDKDLEKEGQQQYQPAIGIWYSTWYAYQGNYFWKNDFGQQASNYFLGDVNGDLIDDAIVFYDNSGSWQVALSDGSQFLSSSQWVIGHGVGSTKQFLADVDGDGKADALIYFQGNGTLYASLSSGSGFGAYAMWKSGFGIDADDVLLADVDGDGKADAVAFYETGGRWDVALSTGVGFDHPAQWIDGFGVGGKKFLADVDGDGRADAITMYTTDGSWWVSLSNGQYFRAYNSWAVGLGIQSADQHVADIDGDGRADAVVFFTDGPSQGGDWKAKKSTGTAFTGSDVWWKIKHGRGASWRGLGRVFGSSYPGAAPVVYLEDQGLWKVLPADDAYLKPNMWNTWESGLNAGEREIRYRPRGAGTFGMYDSGDHKVIDEHIQMITDAKIDYLLFDMTNSIDADNSYIKNRAIEVCKRIAVWNSNPANRKLKYAFAIGKIQFDHNPLAFEEECEQVRLEFLNHPEYGGSDHYYYLDGKPLIVNFSLYTDRQAIETWGGNKFNQNQFTIKWAQGRIPEFGNPPVADYGQYFGWVVPNGSFKTPEAMVVNPGHNPNNGDPVVSRLYNGEHGGFYRALCWDKVIEQKPKMVIIASFNEFAEENAVEPANTELLEFPSEKWYNTSATIDPHFYWNMTKDKIDELLAP